MPKLILRDDRGDHSFTLSLRSVIGREQGVEIPVFGPAISRRHAEIARVGTLYWIRDLESSNGTFLNGKRIDSAILHDGDEIRIGPEVLVFVNPEEEEELPGSLPDAEDTLSIITSIDAVTVSARGTALPAAGVDETMLEQRLATMCRFSKEIGSVPTVDELLDKVLEEIFHVLPAADRGFVMLLGQEPGELIARATRFREGQGAGAATISRTIARKAIDGRQALLCADAMADERFSAAASVARFGIRSCMCAPLLAGEEVVGTIHIDCGDPMKTFSEADLDLLAAMAAQAAIYIQNAQLHERSLKVERLAAVGETVAGLAHCVKNILNSIQAGAYVVDMGIQKAQPESVTKGWDIVKRNSKLMSELLMDLLSYSKERKPVREPTDVNGICGEMCRMMEAKAQSVGAELRHEPAADLPQAQLDPIGIQRCLSNLVTNAIDAMNRENGLVLVATRWLPGPRLIEIRVADNGCGIDKEGQASIFDLFFSTKGSKGTGLGLAVTRKIIEEHGGGIRVDSTLGEGTEFRITLPASAEAGS